MKKIVNNKIALVYSMTDFLHICSLLRVSDTLKGRDISDPTLRSLCGVNRIQPLRGCQKSVIFKTRANKIHLGIIPHLGRRYGLMALMGILLWSACTKDDEIVLKVNTQKYQGADKTYVDENLYTCWSHGDEVIINEESKNITIETVNNQTRCYIAGVQSESSYWSVYPASIATDEATYSNGTISGLVLPATQPYSLADGKQVVPTVMAAYLGSNTGTMDYYNACIALQITIINTYSRSLTLSQLVVKDDVAPLNGSFSITGVNTVAPTLAYAGSTIDEANKSITMSFGTDAPTDAPTLDPNAQITLYVILPPTNSYSGNKFTIEVTAMDGDADGETVYEFSQTQANGASGCFERNQLAPIAINLDNPHTMVLKGKGTEDNPYLLYTADDLKSMQNLVAKGYSPIGGGMPFASAYYRLMNDVADVTLTGPIGTAENNFTGHFDGQNHTLSNLTLALGLFGHISQGATVSNLTVDGATVSLSEATVGGVICANAVRSTIDHCQVTGTVSFSNLPTSVAYVGGIVGNAAAFAESHTTVLNCHNGATMTVSGASANHYVGGLVGHLHNSSLFNSYTMLNTSSSTTAIITAPNATVGGMVGRMDGDAYLVNGYFGLYDQIGGTAGKTADICGDITDGAHISQCYYPNKVYATGTPGVDNLLGTFQFENQSYQVNNTPVGTLLNNTVTSQGTNSGWQSWTTGSATEAPTLSFQ